MIKLITELEESVRIAVEQIMVHKMRSLLTALGVIIGTFAITMMGTLMNGVDKGLDENLNMLGTDTFYVERWPWRDVGDDWPLYRNRPHIKPEQGEALNELISQTPNSHLVLAVPVVTSRERIENGALNTPNITAIGTTQDFPLVNQADIEYGRFFNGSEAVSGRNVVILGYDVATGLFPEGNEVAVGKTVRIRGLRFEVIGVFARQGSFLGMQSFDNLVTLPMRAMRKFYSGNWRNEIRVLKLETSTIDAASDEITGHMRRVRQLLPGTGNDFEINQSRAIEEQIGPVKARVALAGFIITGLSLFVGAIGIMNITFVSVKERTREIGTRRALGARRRTILMQFLIEAISICILGGLVGLILAYGANQLMMIAVPAFPVVFNFNMVIFAAVISVMTGVASGFVPAWQAARMDPAQSLRHE